ncbi:MAG: hypothetical protein HY735_33320, partial [Verrucomicrobia bacterium]|nr:hypothetical protein [Verrucomicrobiota bacterium]
MTTKLACLGLGLALLFCAANPLQAAQSTVVRASNLLLQPGESGNVVVSLDPQGSENTIGFSLSFDSTLLLFTRVTLANGAPVGLQLGPVNLNDAASGRLAVIVNQP